MKTLYLVRHAKSDWSNMRLADHDRPLNARGSRAARLMGDHLANEGIAPDLVICSTALRARQTLAGIDTAFKQPWPRVFEPQVYGADTGSLLALIRRQDDDTHAVMMVGHNPGFQDLAITLAPHGDDDDLAQLYRKLPTGAFIEIELDITSFSDIAPGCGTLRRFVRPKSLIAG